MGTEIQYETSDTALASYLYCSGTRLLRIDRQDPRRCIFIFDALDPGLLSSWQSGQAIVNALAFYQAYQHLKQALFRRDGNGGLG